MQFRKTISAMVLTGGLFAATAAFAYGPHAGCPFAGPMTPPNASALAQSRMQALESMLTLKANQKEAFKAYADVNLAAQKRLEEFRTRCQQKPCADVQSRLERRAEKAAIDAMNLKSIAEARAKLLSVLSAEQKFVLEMGGPGRHCGGMGQGPREPMGMQRGPRMGPGMGMGQRPCPQGSAPMPPRY